MKKISGNDTLRTAIKILIKRKKLTFDELLKKRNECFIDVYDAMKILLDKKAIAESEEGVFLPVIAEEELLELGRLCDSERKIFTNDEIIRLSEKLALNEAFILAYICKSNGISIGGLAREFGSKAELVEIVIVLKDLRLVKSKEGVLYSYLDDEDCTHLYALVEKKTKKAETAKAKQKSGGGKSAIKDISQNNVEKKGDENQSQNTPNTNIAKTPVKKSQSNNQPADEKDILSRLNFVITSKDAPEFEANVILAETPLQMVNRIASENPDDFSVLFNSKEAFERFRSDNSALNLSLSNCYLKIKGMPLFLNWRTPICEQLSKDTQDKIYQGVYSGISLVIVTK